LDEGQLQQLLIALRDDVERYCVAIRGYTPEKMRDHGAPYLQKLEAEVAEVERLIRTKTEGRLPPLTAPGGFR